jgi:hypothetical protein
VRAVIEQSPSVRDGTLKYEEGPGSDNVTDFRRQRLLKVITPVPGFEPYFRSFRRRGRVLSIGRHRLRDRAAPFATCLGMALAIEDSRNESLAIRGNRRLNF